MKGFSRNWSELVVSMVSVALLAGLWPGNIFLHALTVVVLSFCLFVAFDLARKSGQFRFTGRLVFWGWFFAMCVVWLLALWDFLRGIFYPQPHSL